MNQSTQPHKPHWGWSSVVLLSTLLLSPVAATGFLHALAQALPQAFGPAQTSQLPTTAVENPSTTVPTPPLPSESPRRATSEEDSLRRTKIPRIHVRKSETRRFPAIVIAGEPQYPRADFAAETAVSTLAPLPCQVAITSLAPRAPPTYLLA